MAPKSRSGAVSSASFLDLKAELSKKEDEFKKSKARGNGKAEAIVGGVKREEKKTPSWMRKNKGVAARAAKDLNVELEAVSEQTLDSAMAALERKAKMYEKLQKGMSGGLNDKQYENLLVDFDRKAEEDDGPWKSDDDEDAEERDGDPSENDPIVEYQDEFGRTRRAPRSEVPRELLRGPSEEPPDRPEDDPHVIYNPVGYFPTYEPSEERVKQIQKDLEESLQAPQDQHYDASKENRAKGAGFYQFSGDEEARRKQMEELKAARVETEERRKTVGADTETPVNPALEKRKRDLEERRKLIEAKRRKLVDGTGASPSAPSGPSGS